jgi:predicted acylesterase/phospholipase RssA/CRP-like cAMP-binding protein
MIVEPYVATKDPKVRAALEDYFGIEIGPDHPLLEQIGLLNLAGGDWLMQQGEHGDALYFLVRGRMQAWARGSDGERRGTFLNEIVPGDSIGELSLLTGAPRAVGIQAIRDSLLVSIDRATFESLAAQFPTLALKLATNVAHLMQSKSSKARPSTRNLKAVCLLNMDGHADTDRLARKLVKEISQHGKTLALDPARLADLGAPNTKAGEQVVESAGLAHWVHEQEDAHRFVLFLCNPRDPGWMQFALRQSDMVLQLARADGLPEPQPWEEVLDGDAGSAIARRLLILLQPAGRPISGTSAWLDKRRLDFHVHVRDDRPDDIGRVGRIIAGTAVGMVLAGGAARGFAHLGVYRAMEELGMPVDWIGGTSIGGIMGAGLAAHWSTEEAIERARRCFVEGKPFSDYTLPIVSLIKGRRMDRLLKEELNFDIEDLPTPFFCVSCHLDTGMLRVHERGNLAKAVRAGASIPGIIPPAVVEQRLAVDGAVINNLPVDIMQSKPVGTVVAVDLSADKQYEVNYPKVPTAWAILRGRYLPFARRQRVPGFSTVMLKATELGTLSRVRELGRQADLLLKPPVRQFGMTEVKSFDQIVQAGYDHAIETLPVWLEGRNTS